MLLNLIFFQTRVENIPCSGCCKLYSFSSQIHEWTFSTFFYCSISLLQSFSDGKHFCIQKYYSIQILLGTLCGYYMTCMQFGSPQLKQTHNNKHVLMPVLNLDRVLLANSDTCRLVSSKPHISSCFFKNNTCFTFNTKFAISLHIIRILAPGFLKNYSCLTLKTIHLLNLVYMFNLVQ